jgi:hypothetical protein
MKTHNETSVPHSGGMDDTGLDSLTPEQCPHCGALPAFYDPSNFAAESEVWRIRFKCDTLWIRGRETIQDDYCVERVAGKAAKSRIKAENQ